MNNFDFDRMTLLPRYSIISSRSKCDTKVKFGNHTFEIPVVPSNMESVISEDLAEKLAEKGFFYILHRFDIDSVSFVKRMKEKNLITSISIGVNDDSYVLVDKLKSLKLTPDYITIDIAHGHSLKMKNMITYVKRKLPKTFVIGGNVCTQSAVNDLEEWGCDAIKCGIGGGSVCTTYHSTGFGNRGWQASMIKNCALESRVPIIADGSIKEHSDIVKSLVLGATMVMVGGMLAGYEESPGSVVVNNGVEYKTFWGSASSAQSGKVNHIEGIEKLVPYSGKSIFTKLQSIKESLQSAISYGGGTRIFDLSYVDYVLKN